MPNLELSPKPHNMQDFTVSDGDIKTSDYSKEKLEYLNKISFMFYKKSVLDVGCNDGLYSLFCKQSGSKFVLSNDLNETSLQTCTRLFQHFNLNAETSPENLAEIINDSYRKKFDYILFLTVIHRIWTNTSNTDQLKKTFENLKTYCNTAIITDYWMRKNKKFLYKPKQFENFLYNNFEVKTLGQFETDWYESKVFMLTKPINLL
jgi:SAM-dependent methyltransferase